MYFNHVTLKSISDGNENRNGSERYETPGENTFRSHELNHTTHSQKADMLLLEKITETAIFGAGEAEKVW